MSMINSDQVLPMILEIHRLTLRMLFQGRTTQRIGPFLASFYPGPSDPYLSYAVPDPDSPQSRLTSDMFAELRRAFIRHHAVFRMEYPQPLWPNLGAILERNGMQRQMDCALMICREAGFRAFAAEGVHVMPLEAQVDEQSLYQFILTGKRGFGQKNPVVHPAEARMTRLLLQQGWCRAATARVDGEIAGVGFYMTTNREMAGIATLPAFRRRGVAASITSYLTDNAIVRRRDRFTWLSAADVIAQAVYQRLGYQTVGRQLTYSDPVDLTGP